MDVNVFFEEVKGKKIKYVHLDGEKHHSFLHEDSYFIPHGLVEDGSIMLVGDYFDGHSTKYDVYAMVNNGFDDYTADNLKWVFIDEGYNTLKKCQCGYIKAKEAGCQTASHATWCDCWEPLFQEG